MANSVTVYDASEIDALRAELPEIVRDNVGSSLRSGANIKITPDDDADTIVIGYDPDPVNVSTTLYVNKATGSDLNDGTAARPFANPSAAMKYLSNKGPILRGLWTVDIAAGTYSQFDWPEGLLAENPVTIKGPFAGHPNVPTVKITRGYNISDIGLDARNLGVDLVVQDILFEGFNGSTSSAGIGISMATATVFTINCHFTDCYWAVSGLRANYDVKGGIFDRIGFLGDTANILPSAQRNGNGAAFRSLFQTRHAIGLQNAGNLNYGPIIKNSRTGLFAQENSTGHSDWVTYQDNDFGIVLNASSRANCDGSSFKRNGTDIRATLSSNAYVTANTTFGTGADESKVKTSAASGSTIFDDYRIFKNKYQVNGASLRNVYTTFPNVTNVPGSNIVVETLPLGGMFWRDAPNPVIPVKRIMAKIVGELFGTAGTKSFNVRLGTRVVGMTFTTTEVGVFTADLVIYFDGQGTQQMFLEGYRHLGTSVRLARGLGTNPMTADTNLTFEAGVAAAGDSISIYSIDVNMGG